MHRMDLEGHQTAREAKITDSFCWTGRALTQGQGVWETRGPRTRERPLRRT